MKLIRPIAVAALIFSSSMQLHAQLDSCNAFLQGNYVEVGVNWNGAYGSSANAPSGYHPRGASPIINSPACDTIMHGYSNRELGFVADPDKDGWTVGSPAYYGDYYLPGFPQEGWSILSGGVQANAWNGGASSVSAICNPNITGSNTSYFLSGSKKITVWEGMYDSIQITQTTELDTTTVYFTTHVKFKNMGHVTKSNVYYMRTLDPDNDITLSGDYTTKNKIETQYPGNVPLISTWGTHYTGAYLGLGTSDTPAKAFIMKVGLMVNERIDTIYNNQDSAKVLYADSSTSDVGIGLVFKVGNLAPIDSSIIAFAYIFRRGDADSALNSTTKPFPLDTTVQPNYIGNIAANKEIHIYPNPLKGEMTVSGLNVSDQITLYDMMGKNVGSWMVPNDGSNIFNTSNLPTGIYIMRVLDKNGNIKAKLPIQKL